MQNKKGFTLIEMLVVIAIISVLVAVIIPLAGSSAKRAKAATDAANLRSIYGLANSEVYSADLEDALSVLNGNQVKCASYKAAKMYIAYSYPGFIEIMYVDGTPGDSSAKHYNVQYFSDVAADGETSQSTAPPVFPTGVQIKWYDVGAGAWINGAP